MKGFSRANLMYMRAFAEAWPDEAIVQQAVGQLPWYHCQRHDLRLSYLAIPGHQRHLMDDAGGSDDLVGGIAAEVEVVDTQADLERERPSVDLRQGAHHVWIRQIHFDPAELDQLRDLPEDDSRNAPSVRRQELALFRGQRTLEGMDQDMSVKIQHPTAGPWKGGLHALESCPQGSR